MSDALRQIKKEFGPDAVILSARSINQKNLFGIKKSAGIEVTVATDSVDAAMEKLTDAVPAASAAEGKATAGMKGRKVSVRIDDTVSAAAPVKPLQSRFKFQNGRDETRPASAGMDDAFKERFKNHFVRQGVEDFFVQELLAMFGQIPGAKTDWESPGFQMGLQKAFSEMGISAGIPQHRPHGPLIHGLVGPSGSGKTSAMARMTAVYMHQFHQKVGWITLDTRRVASAAQLQVYGRIIGVPVLQASTVQEFKESLMNFEPMDHIFVDTPGMGIRDVRLIAEVSEYLKHGHVHSVSLVAGASTKNEDLIQILKAYRPLALTGIIISKLDESQAYGNVLNLLIRSKLPVSYFTSGQDIPDGLETATLEKVVELLMNPVPESKPWHIPPGKTAEVIPYAKNIASRFQDHYVANYHSILFHRPECAWAKRIRPENRIMFETVEEALAKEYIPCKTCCSHVPDMEMAGESEIHRVGNGQHYYSR